MTKQCVGVLGARSLVGDALLPLLAQNGWQVIAFSRQQLPMLSQNVQWQPLEPLPVLDMPIAWWISVAPIWILPDYFEWLRQKKIRKIIVLSSTSRFTKDTSSDLAEQAVARRLAEAEQKLEVWATQHHIQYVILRPTLIYGNGKDKNIAEIARFIRQFCFFPVLGQANGLRQPIHAQDVANVCVSALAVTSASQLAYNISGAETLTYRQMVQQIFAALEYKPKILTVPLWLFRGIICCMRIFPRYRQWSSAMAERMNRDLVFDHQLAVQDLAFSPRKFVLDKKDVGL